MMDDIRPKHNATADDLPLRLLGQIDGEFCVFDPRSRKVDHFDIISYTWGEKVREYDCGISGVEWNVSVTREKLDEIKRLMIASKTQFMWVDCVCINQSDTEEVSREVAKMYHYYKSARQCHILVGMAEVWDPQDIVDDLKFIDHVLGHMKGAAIAPEAKLGDNLTKRLSTWVDREWTFGLDKSTVRSAAIDMGVLNCYSTRTNQVRSLFDNLYFSRVWTFQEMLLGKNITMWGINGAKISCIGELGTWMDLATDAEDKAIKLQDWIMESRESLSASVTAILRIIEEDKDLLYDLRVQVAGISCARVDIVNGGPHWWRVNQKGISNIFSAVSIRPRQCRNWQDIFKGLLGIFNGLFTAEEIQREMSGDDVEHLSFAFFRQLSIKTDRAWTKLAISSEDRGEWGWIPVAAKQSRLMSTDCFAGVVNLGDLEPYNEKKQKHEGLAKTKARIGVNGHPRQYMQISLSQGNAGFQFVFKGCNCGKTVKTGFLKNRPIPECNDNATEVAKDETGAKLVQCATILGKIMDPNRDVVEYRKRLLGKLRPQWRISDPCAKPKNWIDRCVGGTPWGDEESLKKRRVHNESMNYRMIDITDCESRLHNPTTEKISCEVRVSCGCSIIAPFSWIFEGITAVEGSFLGSAAATLGKDNRIILSDGLGLVQIGDIGKTFNLVAFGGNIDAHEAHAKSCRTTKLDDLVTTESIEWPKGRALVREDFSHTAKDTLMMRGYGYVETEGSGNLLISRTSPVDNYQIIGVCIDEEISNSGEKLVIIQ